MGNLNAVVVSQPTLAKLMGCDVRTVQRAVAALVADNWIQVVQLAAVGTVNAYVVNSMVAWGQSRKQLHLTAFSATVIASLSDQPAGALKHRDLQSIPALFPGEQQLPTGPGEDPPSQPTLNGIDEPSLPARSIDPETGEILSSPEVLALQDAQAVLL